MENKTILNIQASGLPPQDEHDSNESVTLEQLEKLGVLYWSVDSIDQVNSIAIQRDYKNRDHIVCSPQAMVCPPISTRLGFLCVSESLNLSFPGETVG
jgi:hypothetical protein